MLSCFQESQKGNYLRMVLFRGTCTSFYAIIVGFYLHYIFNFVHINLQILVFAAFICACFAASRLRGGGSGNDAAGFAAVWTSLLLIAISILGTMIMRKFQSPLAIGFLLGVILVMNFQMLILFAGPINFLSI